VGPHHDALLVAEIPVELAGTARVLAAALPLLSEERPGGEEEERESAKRHG
jgi:hypothetical protein